ncbi:MAG: hypothetical protein M1832_005463 [Thelocarpon impressellum]|nr:MAG: hypothetical protein M1832_005463 [Thelocarpon impressellum]
MTPLPHCTPLPLHHPFPAAAAAASASTPRHQPNGLREVVESDHRPLGGPAGKRLEGMAQSTLAVHGDDFLNSTRDVAPALHVSSTYRYAEEPDALVVAAEADVETEEGHVYSRITSPNSTRLEALLSSLLSGRALTYASGLAALHAALVYLNPRRLSIGDGYHGSHGVVGLHQKLTGMAKLPLDCPAEDLHEGDVVHLETPLNPTGEALSIAEFAQKAHSRGALLLVDATFGPPGLQDPFALGADVVMHSGTKYLGGHSDMLCGVLAVPTHREEWFWGLWRERCYLGNVMGSFEGWLGVRSLRTLELRVQRQSRSAGELVAWLHRLLSSSPSPGDEGAVVRKVVHRITHASLQAPSAPWLAAQMPAGYGPVFAVWMRSAALARRLPARLALFHHATSLGGVESLIEWRAMSDAGCDTRLLRVSVGVEACEDLREDLLRGFKALAAEEEREDVEGEHS